MKTIVFDISDHGFGHLALSAPVIDAFNDRFPNIRIVLRTGHAPDIVRSFIAAELEQMSPPPEATMISQSANDIDLLRSAAAYSELHADWEGRVEAERRTLRAIHPLAVVANVNPLSLAAASRAGIPTIGFCCMNWLDVYIRYFSHRSDARKIIRAMSDAYARADIFLQPRPHMSMDIIPTRRSIGPIARLGRACRDHIRRRLAILATDKIVMVSLGGLPNPAPLDLPRIRGVHWLLRRAIGPRRPDVSAIEDTGCSTLDALASVDIVLSKDSYCTVVEAAAAGVGLVMVPRPNWPEADCLAKWGKKHCNFAMAPCGFHDVEGLREAVTTVLDGEFRPAIKPTGAREAVDIIAQYLD